MRGASSRNAPIGAEFSVPGTFAGSANAVCRELPRGQFAGRLLLNQARPEAVKPESARPGLSGRSRYPQADRHMALTHSSRCD